MKLERSNRLQKLPPYLFADLRRKMAEARAKGVDVITLGIGDPDFPTADPVVKELVRAIDDKQDANRHRYGCDVPVEALPDAIQRFYARRFGVQLELDQIVVTMGSKDAIAKFPMAFLNPGDVALATEPGYPTYNIGHTFAGAVTHYLPLLADNDYLPDLDATPAAVRRLGKLLWLNYPNNPTTAVCDLAFYERAVEFARANELLICSDLAYSENTFDGFVAPSALAVDGAEDSVVEFFSLSKAFSMTGWRVGCAVGHRDAVAGLRSVQDNVDNGQLRAIQAAAVVALDHADELIPPINDVYRRRRDLVIATLNQLGWDLEAPKGTLYLWVPVPDGFDGSIAFAAHLLETAGVAVTPGIGYGEHGEGFFRISLTYPDKVLKEAMERLAGAL
ncbi:MAG: aminotransferase class I/II-fold pyridoxal phosphate-dependent enzyme [Fimbriimonadaceae bacterium]|nr:aminotransferase class I/II-fold pyridoxal phosphate-dependent enzyme [Fimbriimonadaceae bacterium]